MAVHQRAVRDRLRITGTPWDTMKRSPGTRQKKAVMGYDDSDIFAFPPRRTHGRADSRTFHMRGGRRGRITPTSCLWKIQENSVMLVRDFFQSVLKAVLRDGAFHSGRDPCAPRTSKIGMLLEQWLFRTGVEQIGSRSLRLQRGAKREY
jgi:hypothetical protein